MVVAWSIFEMIKLIHLEIAIRNIEFVIRTKFMFLDDDYKVIWELLYKI